MSTAYLQALKDIAPRAPNTQEAFSAVRAVEERRWADARECARRSGSSDVVDLVSQAHEVAS